MSELRHPPGDPEPWITTTMDPFQVMAHPVRRYVVELLCDFEAPAGELAEMVQHHFGIGWPAVSHHLRILHRGGFVRVRDEWPHRLYRLHDDALARLELRLAGLRRRWESRRGVGYGLPETTDEAAWPSDAARLRREASAARSRALDALYPDDWREAGGAPGEGLAETRGV